jgi:hypothetical protein
VVCVTQRALKEIPALRRRPAATSQIRGLLSSRATGTPPAVLTWKIECRQWVKLSRSAAVIRTAALGTTRSRWPPASRSAYWGSSAFLWCSACLSRSAGNSSVPKQLTLNQRVAGSSPAAPTINQSLRQSLTEVKLERFAFVPTFSSLRICSVRHPKAHKAIRTARDELQA